MSYDESKREYYRNYRKQRRALGLETMGNERKRYEPGEEAAIVIPERVLRERDRAYAVGWPSWSAEFFGDPLTLRSALERANARR